VEYEVLGSFPLGLICSHIAMVRLLAWMYGSVNQLVEVGKVAFPIVLLL